MGYTEVKYERQLEKDRVMFWSALREAARVESTAGVKKAAARLKHREVLSTVCETKKKEQNWTPITYTIDKVTRSVFRYELLEVLLDLGADPDQHDESGSIEDDVETPSKYNYPLPYAVKIGDADAVKLLVAYGADVFLRVEEGKEESDGFGGEKKFTHPLHFSTPMEGVTVETHKQIWDILLGAMRKKDPHADLNTPDSDGITMLAWGAANISDDDADLFIEWADAAAEIGARVDVADKEGMTALCEAAKAGKSRIVEWLLKNGADPRNLQGGEQPILLCMRESWQGRKHPLPGGSDFCATVEALVKYSEGKVLKDMPGYECKSVPVKSLCHFKVRNLLNHLLAEEGKEAPKETRPEKRPETASRKRQIREEEPEQQEPKPQKQKKVVPNNGAGQHGQRPMEKTHHVPRFQSPVVYSAPKTAQSIGRNRKSMQQESDQSVPRERAPDTVIGSNLAPPTPPTPRPAVPALNPEELRNGNVLEPSMLPQPQIANVVAAANGRVDTHNAPSNRQGHLNRDKNQHPPSHHDLAERVSPLLADLNRFFDMDQLADTSEIQKIRKIKREILSLRNRKCKKRSAFMIDFVNVTAEMDGAFDDAEKFVADIKIVLDSWRDIQDQMGGPGQHVRWGGEIDPMEFLGQWATAVRDFSDAEEETQVRRDAYKVLHAEWMSAIDNGHRNDVLCQKDARAQAARERFMSQLKVAAHEREKLEQYSREKVLGAVSGVVEKLEKARKRGEEMVNMSVEGRRAQEVVWSTVFQLCKQ